MAKKGMMNVKKTRSVSMQDIYTLLKNRAVLGYKVESHNRKATKTGKEYFCYPVIITEEEWDLAHQNKAIRHAPKPKSSNGTIHRNLFEGSLFCACCGSRIGVKLTTKIGYKEYVYLKCNGWEKGKECNSGGKTIYKEDELLNRFQNFHWDKFFADKKHNEQIINKRKALQEFEAEFRVAQNKITNIEKTILDSIETNTEVDLKFLCNRKKELEDELDNSKFKKVRCASELNKLEKNKTGKAKSKEIQSKISDFKKLDKNNIQNRKKFINWLHSENLVMTYDFINDVNLSDKGGIGIGNYKYNTGKITEIDSTIEDSVVLGLDLIKINKLKV